MATVRKRSWTAGGKTRTAFVVHYGSGEERGQETFTTKREADARRVEIERDLQRGAFKRINRDITLAEAAQQWLDHVRARGRKPTTLAQYKSHLVRINRVAPALGKMKLAQLRKGHVADLFGALLKAKVSDATARKIITSVKGILNYAVERDWIAQNDALTLRFAKPDRGADTAFPEKAEVDKILRHAGSWYPVLLTAASTGMRASELRGLLWRHVDFEKNEIHVRQRADDRGQIGPPKSNPTWTVGEALAVENGRNTGG